MKKFACILVLAAFSLSARRRLLSRRRGQLVDMHPANLQVIS